MKTTEESTVQVTASLIESLAKRAEMAWANNIARDLRTLLSQPTPSAEEEPMPVSLPVSPGDLETSADAVRDIMRDQPRDLVRSQLDTAARRLDQAAELLRQTFDRSPTAPPRIEDMAPGTTFRITEDEDDEIWTVQDNRVAVCSTHGVGRYLDVFDPSTIRDVTPPKEQR